MRTEKQIAASRENGRKSHGAVTPEGKARIVAANLLSGVYAENLIAPWEHEEEFGDLSDEYRARHPAKSPEARCLVDRLIMCEWQLRRFDVVEGILWQELSRNPPPKTDSCVWALEQGDRKFARLQQRINSTLRAFHKALAELERLEARDREIALPPPPDASAIYSRETHLQVLGSLRQIASEASSPAPGHPAEDETEPAEPETPATQSASADPKLPSAAADLALSARRTSAPAPWPVKSPACASPMTSATAESTRDPQPISK